MRVARVGWGREHRLEVPEEVHGQGAGLADAEEEGEVHAEGQPAGEEEGEGPPQRLGGGGHCEGRGIIGWTDGRCVGMSRDSLYVLNSKQFYPGRHPCAEGRIVRKNQLDLDLKEGMGPMCTKMRNILGRIDAYSSDKNRVVE